MQLTAVSVYAKARAAAPSVVFIDEGEVKLTSDDAV
jgi:AAA+ superfamily predicted ATPase